MEYRQIAIPNRKLSIIEQIFANRGMSPKETAHYLAVNKDDVYSPLLIDRIEQGAAMLLKHIQNQDKIFIQIDSDCDGYTSAAALINYLYKLFPEYTKTHILYRVHCGKEHGLYIDTIPNDIKLVIAPDSSSNDYEQHEILSKCGCDVLVIDHHEASHVSEYACVLNNQLCDYPTKSLSGVGMVYKFCQYLDSLLSSEGYADTQIDLVALGMIADMMDLRDYETAYLSHYGLKNVTNPFFNTMVQMQSYSIDRAGGLCPFAISFYVAPLVNAAIRMGNEQQKILLFESMLDFKGYEKIPSTKRGCKDQLETRAEQACRVCQSLKRQQNKATDECLSWIDDLVQEQGLLENKILVIKLPQSVNKNLTGLIANQLMAKYQHPVLLMNEVVDPETDELCWMGSGRGFETANFTDLKGFMQESGYALLAEGHANAFGVGIADKDYQDFMDYSNQELEEEEFVPCTKVDFIWSITDFTEDDVISIASYGYLWGQGLPEPYIALENIFVRPSDITLMSRDKNPTLKIALRNGVSLIKFKSSEEEYEELTKNSNGIMLDIVGTCALNEWMGNISGQIKVKDYAVHKPITVFGF